MTPASAAQTRFYLLDQRDGGDTRTLVKHVVAHGALDPDRVADAVRAVLAAHPALRTSLHVGVGLEARAHPVDDVPVEVRRVGPHHVADVPRRPFTHGAGPLCSVAAFVGPERTDLVVSVHHAVFDAPSTAILLRHLASAYAGESPVVHAGGPPPDLARARAHWAAALADLPEHDTAVPHTGPGGDPTRGSVRVPLPGEHLRATALETGASPFMQVVAALGIVLGRYADADDVLVAVAVDGRGPRDGETVACFQNTVPVRLRVADPATVLDQALDGVLDAVEHAALPLEEILDLASADGVRRALTRVLCTEVGPAAAVEVGGVRWEVVPGPPPRDAEYDLSVTLAPGPELVVEYRADLVAGPVARRFADAVARAAAGDVDVLGPDRVVLDRLAAGPPLPPTRPVTELGGAPDVIAVRDGASALTYGELSAAADVLARALVAAGVRPGDRVGVALPRAVDLVVAVLGVLRAGAAYVPLPPDNPPERLRHMASDAALAVVVGSGVDGVDGVPVVPVRPEPVPAELPVVTGGMAAYVVYTSGSTGLPKGVVVRHGNVAALLAAFDLVVPDLPEHVVAATALSFDISVLELLWPLARGRTVLLTDHQRVAGWSAPGALYQCTPTVARVLAADPAGRDFLGGLGVLLVGGEPLPDDLAARLAGLVPGPVWNCYGPTETTVWSTVWRVGGGPVHIGHPLAGERWHVVDSRSRPRPVGVPGRLLLSGAGVAAGYWRRPGLTATRFHALPDGSFGYDTGDEVLVDPEHGLRFVDRADAQLKVLGQRVEPGEVEAVLTRHPAVGGAVVVPAFDRTALVAYVVADRVDGLAEHARRFLPPTMVPVAFHAVAELPRTAHGKLDRARAAAWAADLAPPRAPDGAALAVVTGLWARVLGREVSDVDSSFFELGGSSVQLLQVVAALRERYPRVRVADLFRHVTARALAGSLERGDAPEPAAGRGARRARAVAGWARRGERA
ncbi:non-ribosomal peptide synthetase [Saccharothrix obliqua]|uniref:non-ribosomal peptide synthetase n=1 Tax=Saccharothrix obliqua TaxID=2861747 RepID=UPI001C5E29EA|nr:non-ribosomal peptide synthetase [Saccharothrix obliqua]MBW4718332.1 amino acid adenylation domain-containing protein [Saccharothrix obliqua]